MNERTRCRPCVACGMITLSSLLGSSTMAMQAADNPEAAKATNATVDEPKLLIDEAELAGKYYFGDGLGVGCTLTLNGNHEFSFTWHGCMGEYDNNKGTWKLDGDVVQIEPTKPNKCEGFQGTNIRFIPARFGGRQYLVDEFEMPGFCAAAGQGDLPKDIHGEDYVKITQGYALVEIDSSTTIPKRFESFLKDGPVVTKIVRFDDDGNAVLDKGTNNRIAVGMRLVAARFENIELKVTSASEDEAIAQPLYYWNSHTKAAVGDTFTSGQSWFRPRGTGTERFKQPPDSKP